MDKVLIVYWSQGGNTESMARAVADGVIAAGKEAVLVPVAQASPEMLSGAPGFALGCPAMGAEQLEETEMEPFMQRLEDSGISGREIALFGSYGWGGGEWMKNWEKRLEEKGAKVACGEGVICQNAPELDVLEKCKGLGRRLAAI